MGTVEDASCQPLNSILLTMGLSNPRDAPGGKENRQQPGTEQQPGETERRDVRLGGQRHAWGLVLRDTNKQAQVGIGAKVCTVKENGRRCYPYRDNRNCETVG